MTAEEIINTLVFEMSRGSCISLLNDDNGHWAAFSDGIQTCPVGDAPMDIETTFWVPADYWKDTISEAVEYAMAKQTEEQEEEDDDS